MANNNTRGDPNAVDVLLNDDDINAVATFCRHIPLTPPLGTNHLEFGKKRFFGVTMSEFWVIGVRTMQQYENTI